MIQIQYTIKARACQIFVEISDRILTECPIRTFAGKISPQARLELSQKVWSSFDSYCLCHSLFILCPIVYFRRARGANVRGNHKRAGKSSLRSGLPLPLKVPSHTLLPYSPPSLGSAYHKLNQNFCDSSIPALGENDICFPLFKFDRSLNGDLCPVRSQQNCAVKICAVYLTARCAQSCERRRRRMPVVIHRAD